jgi:ankyrin repeat protein
MSLCDDVWFIILSFLTNREIYRTTLSINKHFFQMSWQTMDVTVKEYYPLFYTSKNGYINLCERLLNDKRIIFDTSSEIMKPIDIAIQNDHLSIIQLFMRQSSVEQEHIRFVLDTAVTRSIVNVVDFIIRDHRVDLTSLSPFIIVWASCQGSSGYNTVKYLFEQNYIYTREVYCKLLENCCENGWMDFVIVLLNDFSADPSTNDGRSLHLAAQKGHIDIVKLLSKRISPAIGENNALKYACYNGHYECVKFLLNDPRVDPSSQNQFPIRFAHKNGHKNIVDLLLKHPKVIAPREIIIQLQQQQQQVISTNKNQSSWCIIS